MGFCTVARPPWVPLACCWGRGVGAGVREGGGKTVVILAPQGAEAGLGSGLTRAGLSLQGHLNWPPFCLVMLNVTHLTHQVIIDRLSRKVSALRSRRSWPGSSQWGAVRPVGRGLEAYA